MSTRTWEVDGQQAPVGTEPDLHTGALPPEAQDVAARAVAAGRAAGVRRTLAVWAEGQGRRGVWISMLKPTPAAMDAVLAAVEGSPVAVRVFDVRAVDRPTYDAVLAGVGRAREAEQGPRSDRLLTGRQELAVLAAVLVGSGVVVYGDRSGSGLSLAAGLVLLVAVVAAAAAAGVARGGLLRRSPVVLAGGLVVALLLVWQAVRGLGGG